MYGVERQGPCAQAEPAIGAPKVGERRAFGLSPVDLPLLAVCAAGLCSDLEGGIEAHLRAIAARIEQRLHLGDGRRSRVERHR